MPHAPPPTSCRASILRLCHNDGVLLTDNVRDEQTTRPWGQHGRPHGATEVRQRLRDVKTRGGLTSEDLHELWILAVSRTLPAPRLGPGVQGAGM